VAIQVGVGMEEDRTQVGDHLHVEEHLEVGDQVEVDQQPLEEGLELEAAILEVVVQVEDLLGHNEHLEEGLP